MGCDLNLRDPHGQEETDRMMREAGYDILSMSPLDVTHGEQAKAWIDQAVETYGGIDILYNNAADELFTPFPQMSIEDWHHTLRFELDGIFWCCKFAWSHLVARGGGVILNTASVTGKGGVIALTHQLALEGAPQDIRVNAISPGPIDTPVTAMGLKADPEFRTTYEGWTLLHRTRKPEDTAYAALFLCSDEASFITGINLPVDGGWTAKGGLTAKPGAADIGNTQAKQQVSGS